MEDVSKKRKQDDGDEVLEFKRLALGDAEPPAPDLTAATSTATMTTIDDNAVQQALLSLQCPEWAKQWLRETQGKAHWGFARYIDHSDIEKRLRESYFEYEIDDEKTSTMKAYHARVRKILRHTHEKVGLSDVVQKQFRLQRTRWPREVVDKAQRTWKEEAEVARKRDIHELDAIAAKGEDEDLDLDDDELCENDDLELVKQKFLDGEGPDRYEDDACLREKFQVLRKRFKVLRNKPRLPVLSQDTDGEGLGQGVLSNVFIVVDKACVDSQIPLSGKRYAENGWVFAVDPDYDDPGPMEPLASKVDHRYRGFVRVRLQHLVGDFFVARKYHALERPMEALWREAQKSGDELFVP